jgi:hypothetical protein
MKGMTILSLFVAIVATGYVHAVQPVPPAEYAMVRFVQLSPNAKAADVMLKRTDTESVLMTPAGLKDMVFGSATEYVRVPSGAYAVMLAVGDRTADGDAKGPAEPSAVPGAGAGTPLDLAAPVLAETLTLRADRSYTVAILGLVLPRDARATEDESGFFTRVSALFSGGDAADRDALGLRFAVIEDDPGVTIDPDATRVRVVHAAPGTTSVDVAVAGERGTLVRDLGFGEASRRVSLRIAETTLEVRPTGSRAVALDLAGVELALGRTHTVFIAGTPIEKVPLQVVVLSDAPGVRQGAP